MTKLTHAIDYWVTTAEYGYDSRTAAYTQGRERQRLPSDRPGKRSTVWDWVVEVRRQVVARGVAQHRVAARGAIRKVVRQLPDKLPA